MASSDGWSSTQWDTFHRTGVEPTDTPDVPYRLEGLETGKTNSRRVVELDGDGGFRDPINRAPSFRGKTNDVKKQIPKVVAGWSWSFSPRVNASSSSLTASSSVVTIRLPGVLNDGADKPKGFLGKLFGMPSRLSDALKHATGAPKIVLSRELNLRGITNSLLPESSGVDGKANSLFTDSDGKTTGLFTTGTLRLHVFPDISIGVSTKVIGKDRDDSFRVSLDAEAGVDPNYVIDPSTSAFRVSGGIFLEHNPDTQFRGTALNVLSPLDVLEDRVSIGANIVCVARAKGECKRNPRYERRLGRDSGYLDRDAGSSARAIRSDALEPPLGRPSGSRRMSRASRYDQRDVAVVVTATRDDSVWARVRIWRGLFVKVQSKVKFSNGRSQIDSDLHIEEGSTHSGRRNVGFTAPTVTFEFEANPSETDLSKERFWEFYERGSAKEAAVLESKRLKGSVFEKDTQLGKEIVARVEDERFVESRLHNEFADPVEVMKQRKDGDREFQNSKIKKKRSERTTRKQEWRAQSRAEAAQRRARKLQRKQERMILAKETLAEKKDVGTFRQKIRDEEREERERAKEIAEDERRMVLEAETERLRLEKAKKKGRMSTHAETINETVGDSPGSDPTVDGIHEEKGLDATTGSGATRVAGATDTTDTNSPTNAPLESTAATTSDSTLSSEEDARAVPSVMSPDNSSASSGSESNSVTTRCIFGLGSDVSSPVISSEKALRETARQEKEKLRLKTKLQAERLRKEKEETELREKKVKEEAEAIRKADQKAKEEKLEKLREETRRNAEAELKEIAAQAELRAKRAKRDAKLRERRAIEYEKAEKKRERDEELAAIEEQKQWQAAALKVKKDKEKLEKEQERIAKREEELRLKKEKELVFAEERERKARMKTEETNKGQGSTVNPSGRYSGGTISNRKSNANSLTTNDTTIALVPGHWIDPGEEVGAPGERAINLVIANKCERKLRKLGWNVVRPDLFDPPLSWERYCDWAREQSASGVSLLEIHGQGSDASMEGKVTGVISQSEIGSSALGDALEQKFGRFPMDWRELVVSRVGGAVVESFETEKLEKMTFTEKDETMDFIADNIAQAVEQTKFSEPPKYGCSSSGCPRA